MTNSSLDESIIKSRLLLQNPYAYLNDFGGYSALPINTEASSLQVTQSRIRLENPYAHLNEFGGFSGLHNLNLQKKERYSVDEIEQQARTLQKLIWCNRNKIWPNSVSVNPIEMLDPFIALKFIGYDCELKETLGQFHSNGKLIEVAGTIDKHSKRVHISRRFALPIRNFTAAHELGHAILHETSGLHRDKPLDGIAKSRDPVEFEADKFASFYQMPRNLVRDIFKRLFLTDIFVLNEDAAFALGLGDYHAAKTKFKTLRQLSKLLASSEHYNGIRFVSLAGQFRVSTEAMAIRLEELGLLAILQTDN